MRHRAEYTRAGDNGFKYLPVREPYIYFDQYPFQALFWFTKKFCQHEVDFSGRFGPMFFSERAIPAAAPESALARTEWMPSG